MARCERCGAETGEGASFCSQCGTPTHVPEASAVGAAEPTTRSFPLLARANLLRMRGRWQEAAGLCTEVLRLEPGNASAYSLLGDIHENQGNLDEAIHWYDLALRVNAQSEADAAKRGRAQELLEARQRRAEWQAATQRAAQHPGSGALLREAIQRVIAVAGAAVCGVVLVAAVLVSAGERNAPDDGNESPVPAPPPGKWQAAQAARSPREQALMQELSKRGDTVTRHGQIAEVTVDPRSGDAAVRLLLPRDVMHEPSVAAIRERILRDVLWIAHAVHRVDPNLGSIEVRALGDPSLSAVPEGREYLFIGSVPAENLGEDPDARPPMTEELPRLVKGDLFWHSALRD